MCKSDRPPTLRWRGNSGDMTCYMVMNVLFNIPLLQRKAAIGVIPLGDFQLAKFDVSQIVVT